MYPQNADSTLRHCVPYMPHRIIIGAQAARLLREYRLMQASVLLGKDGPTDGGDGSARAAPGLAAADAELALIPALFERAELTTVAAAAWSEQYNKMSKQQKRRPEVVLNAFRSTMRGFIPQLASLSHEVHETQGELDAHMEAAMRGRAGKPDLKRRHKEVKTAATALAPLDQLCPPAAVSERAEFVPFSVREMEFTANVPLGDDDLTVAAEVSEKMGAQEREGRGAGRGRGQRPSMLTTERTSESSDEDASSDAGSEVDSIYKELDRESESDADTHSPSKRSKRSSSSLRSRRR